MAYPAKEKALESVPLGNEPLVVICHPENPLAKKKSVSLKALRRCELISFEADGAIRKGLERILKLYHVGFNHMMEFDTVDTVKRAVEIDAGISIVLQTTVADEVAKGMLAAVAIQDVRFARPVAAISKRKRLATPAIKRFMAIYGRFKRLCLTRRINQMALRFLIISAYIKNQHGAMIRGPNTRIGAPLSTANKQKTRATIWAINPDVKRIPPWGGRMLETRQYP